MSDKNKKYLFWVDIETTGLYGRSNEFTYGERDHDILEIAYIITDMEGREYQSETYIVDQDSRQIESKMVQYVSDMHTKSGLLFDISSATNGELPKGDGPFKYSLAYIEQHIINGIAAFMFDRTDQKLIMAGSSIHFDRFFIATQMRELNDKLHYRNFDTSTLKMFHELFSDAKLADGNHEASHRAMDDIRYSLDLFRFIKNRMKIKTWNSLLDKL